MNIHPDVAYAELCAENKYLKGRNLALAQTLFETTSERDQLRAELDALKAPKEADDGAAE
ncbi:hypothetical protein [Rhizobium oryziradicis]|uniref:Uncharacterized protein n=1 Tax=Rhizobium oryziradicis TaxID=1867956 RepID=A0A1Q8ZRF1_9HYPH|nr:hypothetical protein [Rhizobium oryziradicis]OLP44655.1 hypothetical protein BJF95_09150 [Rhizobium oryziradicis]